MAQILLLTTTFVALPRSFVEQGLVVTYSSN